MSQVEDTPDEVEDTAGDSAAALPEPADQEPDVAPARPDDGAASQAGETAPPAGESDAASGGDLIDVPFRGDGADVIIGEIPDIHDLSVMKWTARCSIPSHDLLGHYDSREEATQARDEHVATMHTGIADNS